MNPIRDRVIAQLATLMTASRIARLQYDEVALTDPVSKYVEARGSIPADSHGHRHIILSDSVARGQGAWTPLISPCGRLGGLSERAATRTAVSRLPPRHRTVLVSESPHASISLCFRVRLAGTGAALSTWAVRRILRGHVPGPKRRRGLKHYKDGHVEAHTPTSPLLLTLVP